MTNQETRAGRIDLTAAIGQLTLADLTPCAAPQWSQPLAITDAMGSSPAALPPGRVAAAQYVHYARDAAAAAAAGGAAAEEDGRLELTVGRIDIVACPRFIWEVVAYVTTSAVFRSNFAALWAASSAAAARVKFRRRLDAKALSYRYRLRVAAARGGLPTVCPESSTSADCFALLIPPLAVENSFAAGAAGGGGTECCRVETEVRLSSRIQGEDNELIYFRLGAAMTRQLSLAEAAHKDSPLMDLSVEVGEIAISLAQAHVALIWRSAFAHVAEVKAAWSWLYAAGAPGAAGGAGGAVVGQTSKSVLEIEAIRKLLDGALFDAAERERARQALGVRADQHLLDMRVRVAFEALTLSLLAKGVFVCLCVCARAGLHTRRSAIVCMCVCVCVCVCMRE